MISTPHFKEELLSTFLQNLLKCSQVVLVPSPPATYIEKRLEIQESFEVEKSQDQNISNLVGSAVVFFQNK